MRVILKQMAIAITSQGAIGVENELLFTNPRDLQNFAEFTHRTAMIVGRNTAQQMSDHNVEPHPCRPMIIVSTSGKIVTFTSRAASANVYYVDSLHAAVRLAESMIDSGPVLGWTIAGGKMLYEEFLSGVHLNKYHPNQVYLHEYMEEPEPGTDHVYKLKFTAEQIRSLLTVKMVEPRSSNLMYAVATKCATGSPYRRIEVEAEWITDGKYLDLRDISVSNGDMMIQLDGGFFNVTIDQIAGYARREDTNTIGISFKSGAESVEVRPKGNSKGAVNAIQAIIDQSR